MNSSPAGFQKEVEDLLSTIAKYKDVIARAYDARTGAMASPEEEMTLQLLRSLGLIRATGDGQFRLSKPLRELINRGINRHHIRDINVNLGSYHDALMVTVDDYLAAKTKNDELILEATTDEVISVFYEIGDFFADASAEIDQQVKLVIGNQMYGQTRVRVIKAHLSKLDRLQEAHEAITKLLQDEVYNDDPFLSDEKIKLFTRTLRYIDQVKSTHQEIKTVLHRREIVEQRTQSLRHLDAYLRENPTAKLEKAQSHASEVSYFRHAAPLIVQSFVNFETQNQEWFDFYQSTIQSIAQKTNVPIERFSRPESGPTKVDPLVRQKEEMTAIRIINDLIKHVYLHKTAVSVNQFKREHILTEAVTHSYWLYISRIHPTRLLLSPKSKLAKQFRVHPVYAHHQQLEGNRTVTDVVISHIHAPVDVVEKLKSGFKGESSVLL